MSSSPEYLGIAPPVASSIIIEKVPPVNTISIFFIKISTYQLKQESTIDVKLTKSIKWNKNEEIHFKDKEISCVNR